MHEPTVVKSRPEFETVNNGRLAFRLSNSLCDGRCDLEPDLSSSVLWAE